MTTCIQYKHIQCHLLYFICTWWLLIRFFSQLDLWPLIMTFSLLFLWYVFSFTSVKCSITVCCYKAFPLSLCLYVPDCQSTPSWQPLSSNGDSLIRSQGQAAATAPCKEQQHRARYVVLRAIKSCILTRQKAPKALLCLYIHFYLAIENTAWNDLAKTEINLYLVPLPFTSIPMTFWLECKNVNLFFIII